MALKSKLTSDEFEKLDAGLKALYRKEGNGYLLDLEDDPAAGMKGALQTEREAREKTEKALKDLQKRIEEAGDIETLKKAQEELRDLKAKAAHDGGNFEEAFKIRVGPILAEHEKALKKLADDNAKIVAERDELVTTNQRMALRTELVPVALEKGIRKTAIEDMLTRAERVWRMDPKDKKLRAFNPDGTPIFAKKNGLDPVSMDEWVVGLQEPAPHLFEASTGTQTPPGSTTTRVNGAMTITRDQARDAQAYRSAREQAQKAGVELRVVD